MERRLSRSTAVDDEGMSLGEFLQKRMGLTRKEISQAKFREKGICVDGRRTKVNAVLQPGQWVEVLLDKGEKTSPQLSSSKKKIEILYEDRDVIVLNKPSGLSVHPAGRKSFAGDTLANRLAFYLREKEEDCVIRIFGRLDRDTSGVVLAAKNQAAAARLERQRETGDLKKTYLAVCCGLPPEQAGEIQVPMSPDPEDRRRMQVCPVCSGGKPARTHYEVVQHLRLQGKACALVRLRLDTGRMHQIRVHMAYLGCPLLGDPLYDDGQGGSCGGGRGSSSEENRDFSAEAAAEKAKEAEERKKTNEMIARTALHASELVFRQPFGGEKIRIEAPIPKDIARILNSVIE